MRPSCTAEARFLRPKRDKENLGDQGDQTVILYVGDVLHYSEARGGCNLNTALFRVLSERQLRILSMAQAGALSKATPARATSPRRLHPLPLRIMHWINAAAIFIMIGSGWKIYNDDILFSFLRFPDAIVIGKWAQYGLQWHFFGMW